MAFFMFWYTQLYQSLSGIYTYLTQISIGIFGQVIFWSIIIYTEATIKYLGVIGPEMLVLATALYRLMLPILYILLDPLLEICKNLSQHVGCILVCICIQWILFILLVMSLQLDSLVGKEFVETQFYLISIRKFEGGYNPRIVNFFRSMHNLKY